MVDIYARIDSNVEILDQSGDDDKLRFELHSIRSELPEST